MKRLFFFLILVIFVFGCSPKERQQKYGIARDPSWFPLQLNQFIINFTGFTNALIPEIAKDQKLPIILFDVSWNTLIQGLENKEYAGILSAMNRNLITESKYSFSDPIILLGPQLIVRKDSKATSLNDLTESIVGINQFDDTILIAQNYRGIVIRLYENMATALEDLAYGAIDGVLLDTLTANSLVPSLYPNVLKIVTPPLSDKAIRLLTLKDQNKDLMDHFNKGLSNLKNSSRYSALRKQFFLPPQ